MGRIPETRLVEAIKPLSLSGGCKKVCVFVSEP
jgi:hypothetical protein